MITNQDPSSRSVPRQLEKRVRSWVRFQFIEELQEQKVQRLPKCIPMKRVEAGETCSDRECVNLNGAQSRSLTAPHYLVQKKGVLSESALPEELRLALAKNMQNDLFHQVRWEVVCRKAADPPSMNVFNMPFLIEYAFFTLNMDIN